MDFPALALLANLEVALGRGSILLYVVQQGWLATISHLGIKTFQRKFILRQLCAMGDSRPNNRLLRKVNNGINI